MHKQQECSAFVEFDVEKFMAENEVNEIDLHKLLDIN